MWLNISGDIHRQKGTFLFNCFKLNYSWGFVCCSISCSCFSSFGSGRKGGEGVGWGKFMCVCGGGMSSTTCDWLGQGPEHALNMYFCGQTYGVPYNFTIDWWGWFYHWLVTAILPLSGKIVEFAWEMAFERTALTIRVFVITFHGLTLN